MKIYNLDFQYGLFLAPLSGYTSWPMRVLCRQYGAELAYTEMISADGLIRNAKNTIDLLERPDHDKPLIAQIFTASPHYAGLAAKILEHEGFDGIDINMGCPVKKVVSKGSGAALMKDVSLAVQMAEAVLENTSAPVSIKMRAGWDSNSLNAEELAQAMDKIDINCLILHPRTRTDMYSGKPRSAIVQKVRNATRLPFVASGDIKTMEDMESARSLGADAFMIGRSAIGRPWIFTELKGSPAPDMPERKEIMMRHLDMLCSYMGTDKGLRYMRKFISSYIKGLPGAALFRQQACTTEDFLSLKNLIIEYFTKVS